MLAKQQFQFFVRISTLTVDTWNFFGNIYQENHFGTIYLEKQSCSLLSQSTNWKIDFSKKLSIC